MFSAQFVLVNFCSVTSQPRSQLSIQVNLRNGPVANPFTPCRFPICRNLLALSQQCCTPRVIADAIYSYVELSSLAVRGENVEVEECTDATL